MLRRFARTQRAFTLVEMMGCIVIIAALAAVVISRISDSSQTAKVKACQHNCVQINSAVDRYFFEHEAFPPDLDTINTLSNFPEGIPVCPVSGSAYSLNSTTNRVEGHPAAHP